MHFIRRLLAVFGMFRDGKHDDQGDQGLLGWSMLDHDDTVDICDFDEYSTPSLHLFENVNSDAVTSSTSTNSSLSKGRKCEQLSRHRLPTPASEPTTPEVERQKSSVGSVLNLATSSTPTSPQTRVSLRTGCSTSTNAWISRFVPDETQATGICGPLPRKRRKTCHFQRDQCAIDESSGDDSSGDIHHTSAGARTTIDEVTEDELNSPVDATSRSPGMGNFGSQPPSLENANQQVFEAHEVHAANMESSELRQSAVKNGFEERLLSARQKESSDLTLWKFYKENANFPKMLRGEASDTLTARVLTIESIYGIAYCACEIDNACNLTSKMCLMLPLELSEREKLDSGIVLRIFHPWKEHTLGNEKVLSAVQYFEVVERPPPENVD